MVALLVILGSMFAFIRMDLGFRIFRPGQQVKASRHPEQMV